MDEDISIKPFSLVLDRIKGNAIAEYTISTDRILEAASSYYIIFDPRIKYAGLAGKWGEQDDKLCARIQNKCDIETVVHELIHLGHNYLRKPEVSDDFSDNSQRDNLENAIEIATELFLRYSPELRFQIRDSQIAKVLKTIERYGFKYALSLEGEIDSTARFFRNRLNTSELNLEGLPSRVFRASEEFDYHGIFNNYYWEELRECLLGRNYQLPKRQRFLFC